MPRAYHWVDGSAYVNHVELVRKARGAEMPASFWTDPLVYQGGSDDLLGARDDAPFGDTAWGIDLEAEIAVITDDVPMGDERRRRRRPHQADHARQRLVVARASFPGELAKGFGFYQSKPATAFSPVAVTPDELGDAWRDSKVHLPLVSRINGRDFGHPDAGTDMTFSFAQLIAHVTKTRRLGAGAIVGSGTVSNYDRSRGSELPRREAHARTDWSTARRARRSCNSVIACPSRCSTRDGQQHFRRARQPRGQVRWLDNGDFHQAGFAARAPGPRGRCRPGSRARRR